MEKYTIGIDFGSLSARAVLMRVSDGVVIASRVYSYPNKILCDCLPDGTRLNNFWALQVPADYQEAFRSLIPPILLEADIRAEQVIGLGIDATSCTILPTTMDGTPLCELAEYCKFRIMSTTCTEI